MLHREIAQRMEAYSGCGSWEGSCLGSDHATTPPDLGPVPSVEQLQLQMVARYPAAAKRIAVDDAAAPFTRVATNDMACSHDRPVVAPNDVRQRSGYETNGAALVPWLSSFTRLPRSWPHRARLSLTLLVCFMRWRGKGLAAA